MSDVKSKNLYELLGNDHDQDSDKEPEPPTKAIDKTSARIGKREAPKEKTEPAQRNRDPERRRGGFTGSERAFRDRPAGRSFNREGATNEDGTVKSRDPGAGAQRGGRGPRGPRRGGDRHVNRSGRAENPKQAEQGWGAQTGEGEWNDEKAGEAMAQQEVKQDGVDANEPAAPVDGDGNTLEDNEEPEPEDTSKSYTDYLKEQAQKKLEGLGLKEARAPNEGSKENKKWKSAKELTKDNEGESYFIGEGKARRERERSQKKTMVDIDYSIKEQPRESRGGRGGGRGRGGDRGGDRGGRGGGRGRGDGEFRGSRGAHRGRGRGGDGPTVAVNDEKAFPSLGGN